MYMKKIARNTIALSSALIVCLVALVGCSSEEEQQRAHERKMQAAQLNHEVRMANGQGVMPSRINPNQYSQNGVTYYNDTKYYDRYGTQVTSDYAGNRYSGNGSAIGHSLVPLFIAGAVTGYVGAKFYSKYKASKRSVDGRDAYYDKKGNTISKFEYDKRSSQSQRDRATWASKEKTNRASYKKKYPSRVVSPKTLKQKRASFKKKRTQRASTQANNIKKNKGKTKALPGKLTLNKKAKGNIPKATKPANKYKVIVPIRPTKKKSYGSNKLKLNKKVKYTPKKKKKGKRK
jgi:hypothetical protein